MRKALRSTSTDSSRSASAPRPLPDEPQAVALIAAAGSGERLGAGGPKALVELAGRPLVGWCIEAFARSATVSAAVLVAPPGHEAEFEALAADGLDIKVVAGGSTRAESVGRGLGSVGASADIVVVHDAARPLVTAALIDATVASLRADPAADGVIAAAPVTDTIKRAADDLAISATEPREGLWAAQTPQVFWAKALRAAHDGDAEEVAAATDDAMLVERAGGRVLIEPAPATNLKVTSAADLRVAKLLLGG